MARSADKENKVNVSARIHPAMKERIEELAAAEDRTVSQWVERLITRHMQTLAPPVSKQRPARKRPEPDRD